MERFGYSVKLAALDFTRLWASTQHHVIIVAGIVLPILLLLGLKRGHVAELREELLCSPTGRQVMFWSGQQGALMTTALLGEIEAQVDGVEIALPEIDRIVDLSAGDNEQGVTLFATKPGDPTLVQAGCDLSGDSPMGLVLSRLVVTKLAVSIGDDVVVTVRRRAGGREESATVTCQVAGVLDQPTEKTAIGFANFELLDKFEQWIRGFQVGSLDWPSSGEQVGPKYPEYLVFLEGRSSKLTDDDIRSLGYRGFEVAEDVTESEERLGGYVQADKAEALRIMRLRPIRGADAKQSFVNYSAAELESVTQADDVVVPWNGFFEVAESGKKLMGLSLKRRTWLRNYLVEPDIAFHSSVDTASYLPAGDQAALQVPLRDGVLLNVGPYKPETVGGGDGGEEDAGAAEAVEYPQDVFVVPVQFLARLRAYGRGDAVYDAATGGFVPVPEPSVYGKAKLYAKTIDDVPPVVDSLLSKKFSVISESGRISEIHEQDSSLQLLVIVVGLGVFLFGVLTVLSVLVDSTDRKRGVIGILRVMGVSREGVFILVLIRAAAIGVLAGVVAGVAGWAIEYVLGLQLPADSVLAAWKPDINIDIQAMDVVVVMLGAVACAGIGAVFPAWKAARLDPFDAIVEGRFS